MRIALVDPSRTILKFVARMLHAYDRDVLTFTSSVEALASIKNDLSIGVLITSFEVEPISGPELCHAVRALGSRRPIYILLMSSDEERLKIVAALDAGADDFVSKPPVPEELLARLRAAERFLVIQRELILLATTDVLTGLSNRRAFFEMAVETFGQLQTYKTFSTVMVDIDHFKSLNDRYGHSVGDEALRQIAQTINQQGHPAGRIGGEEFAILLKGIGLPHALQIAETIRKMVASKTLTIDGHQITVTCSLGVSEYLPNDTIDTLLQRADQALYSAKSSGRNKVVAFSPELATEREPAGIVRIHSR